ncbi:uncharacterized protein EAE98_000578 [Botrytis deweyae]|uniref:Heterokaryon incompatibility domain-containing protein n=1 Tax=Botrytis deweyae TaxID=2478750 RepID=A0ABQ7J382_9HELO|nr:uncharacterized protein EAE98_000578 [Botrytis deweyae]KAF7940451.1 hypothetical protein EAE98_000578 [Botrytis deweyae]
MSKYSYSTDPLNSDSIRLLGLMPAKDLASPIHCRLHDYSLRESDRGIHLYEALSYVWGSPESSKVVYINNSSLSVTANLYTALLHLRDCTFERIIWVDSICINQENDIEKSHQIQLMAKIYGQANRVIVYLGDEADDSNQALESIRFAAEGESPGGESPGGESPGGESPGGEFPEGESLDRRINEMNQRGVLELLKRPWFERIWVLQEVGFARQILMMCGSAIVDGYIFSTGFSQLFYNRQSDLLDLIRPVMYLIRGAIFRPKHAIRPSGALSLGTLVDMYHTRKATKRHDKVYALLSMSSESSNLAGLSPDYKVTWATLLERLVKFIISQDISLKTWEDKEIALIESKGYVLGRVHSIEIDSTRHERQCVNIEFKNQPSINKGYTRWILQASAKSIQQGDLVCHLQGTSKPAIIRPYKDHFAIILIAVTLQDKRQIKDGCFDTLYDLPPIKKFLRDFLLIWNWEQGPDNLESQAEYEGTIERYKSVPGNLKTDKNRAVNLINVSLVLTDAGDYENAENILQEKIKSYEGKLGRENTHILALKETLAWMYHQNGDRMKSENFFLQVIQTRNDLQGKYHQDTLRNVAKLGLVYMKEGFSWSLPSQSMITRLSNQIENNRIGEEDMIQIGESFNRKMMKLMLDQNKENFQVTEDVVKAAARNTYFGYEVMKLLFEKRGEEITITKEMIKIAAENLRCGYKLMVLLFEKRGKEITITEEVVKAAVGNRSTGYEIMMLLFEKRDEEITITKEMIKIAVWNWDQGFKLMKLLLDKRGKEITITKELIKAAIGNRDNGYNRTILSFERRGTNLFSVLEIQDETERRLCGQNIVKLLLKERGEELTIPEEVVVIIASNFTEKVMALLLEKQREKIGITQEILKAAAVNAFGGEIIKLLLEERGKEVIVTEEIMKTAAANPFSGKEIIKLLLEKRGEEVIVTDDIMKAAASNQGTDRKAIMLLLKHQATDVII